MNILQILPSLDVGGVETGTVDLARYLASHGHKAIVVSGGGRLVKQLEMAGVRHYTLPVGKKSIPNIIRMIKELSSIIRDEAIDIVHARSRVPAIIAFFACKSTRKIFITTAHGYYRKHAFSEVMGWGRFVIVASNIMARHMARDFGVPYERLRLIPRGVDLDRFKFRDPDGHIPKEFTIGMVSRITPLKGHVDFIKAISILYRQIPQLKVLIAGDAPKAKYREELELLTRRLGLSRTIEFLGAKEDVPAVMGQLDVLVSATVTPEAFGRAIIEAQAAGVPVVSTRVGGVVDIIEDGRNGLLAAANDPGDLADKILKIYKDNELAERLALEGRSRVEKNFDSETMTKRTIAVYEEAIKSLNILVIKISAIGDCILSVPSLRAIRAKFASANIKALIGIQAREVLDRCPYINDKIVCDFKGKDKGLAGLLKLARRLRGDYYDIVIDLQNNRKSHILAFLTYAPLRYGYDNGKLSFLLNKKVKDDAPYLDPIDHQFRTLKLAGVKPQEKSLELWPSEADGRRMDEFLKDNWVKPGQALVGINVRASSRWAAKNWPASHIAELSDRLAKEFNIRVILTGSREDVNFTSQILKAARSKPIMAVGKTDILELACLIKRFKAYITPDSAPMHIASAVGTPFIALFGPTDPKRHIVPYGNYTAMKKDLKCIPCYSTHCIRNFKCMKDITVAEVFEVMKRNYLNEDVTTYNPS